MTGVIDRLEAKGLVMREVDPNDRRARLLFLTPEGLRVLEAADRAAHESRDVLLGPCRPKNAGSSCSCWKSWWSCTRAGIRRACRPSSQEVGNTLTIRQRISDAEWQARLTFAACYRLVARYGMAGPDLQPHHRARAG